MKADTDRRGADDSEWAARRARGMTAARGHRDKPSGRARVFARVLPRAFARALRGTAVSLATGGLLLAAPVAHADDENPETLIRQGVQLRKKGQNEKAHGYFQRAYELGHTSRAAAQLGLCDVTLGQWQEADTLLTEALASTDPWVEANRAAVEKGRTLARGHLGSVTFSHLPEGALAEIGNQPAVGVSDGAVLWAPAGGASVRIRAPGYKVFEQEITFEVGKTVELRADLQALPKPPPVVAKKLPSDAHGAGEAGHGDVGAGAQGQGSQGPQKKVLPGPSPEDEHTRQTLRLSAYIAGGLGVAALGSGVVLWQMGVGKANAIEAAGPKGTNKPYDEANGNYQTFEKVGVGLMIGGGVVLVSGVLGFLLTSPDETEKEKSTKNSAAGVSFVGSAQAWHVGLSGTF